MATQTPLGDSKEIVHMINPSQIGLKKLNFHPAYTVGYGSKDHNPFGYYAVVASLYGEGYPIRLANDRYDQFQSGIKRHPFDIHYQLSVDKKTLKFQSFRGKMNLDGPNINETKLKIINAVIVTVLFSNLYKAYIVIGQAIIYGPVNAKNTNPDNSSFIL